MVAGLEKLHVVVVAARHHRRPAVEPDYAPLGEPAVFRAVRSGAGTADPDGQLDRQVLDERPDLTQRLARRGQLRQPPVRRVDDERRTTVIHDRRAVVEPEVVVAAHGAPAAPGRQRFGPHLARLEQTGAATGHLGLLFRRFLVGQELFLPESRGPLQRRHGAEVPHALQVGPPVGGARRRLRRDRGRHEREGGECGDSGNDGICTHWKSLLAGFGNCDHSLAARGESPTAFDWRGIPRAGVASRSKMPQFAPSSRLATRAPRQSRCNAGFHHGLLPKVAVEPAGEPR